MGLIPNDTINQVIERSDIVETIGNYTALKKAGQNYKALCPFHLEKSPSFVVNPTKQIFHCFGCGVGGNVLGFIMRQERLEFPAAVRFLAEKAGITIVEEDQASESPTRKLREEIYKVNALAASFFHDILLGSRDESAKLARDYLKGRGIHLETVKKFQLGFAPNEWEALLKYLKTKDISEELMAKAGLVISREGKSGYYDRFRNRVIFPIADIQGRTVAFGARTMEASEGAKYINSPETPVYTKGQHLFGLHLTKAAVTKLDQIIVVEGYMDMIMPAIHGVDNIAASLGTALTIDQIRLLRRYTPNVVMLYDADPAGQAAMVRSLDALIDEGMHVRVAALSQDEDPDSFIRKEGLAAFNQRIAHAQPLLDFKYDWLKSQFDPATVEGKSKIAQELLATINRFKSEVAKYELTKSLAQKMNIPEGVLFKQAATGKSQPVSFQQQPEVKAKPSTSAVVGQELLLALFLKDPAWVKAAQSSVGPEDFSDGVMRQVVEAVWSLDQAGAWSVNDLLLQLNDEAAINLVTRLISMDEGKLGDQAKVFQDCLDKITQEKRKKARAHLMDAIRRAEAVKDTEKLEELTKQFSALFNE